MSKSCIRGGEMGIFGIVMVMIISFILLFRRQNKETSDKIQLTFKQFYQIHQELLCQMKQKEEVDRNEISTLKQNQTHFLTEIKKEIQMQGSFQASEEISSLATKIDKISAVVEDTNKFFLPGGRKIEHHGNQNTNRVAILIDSANIDKSAKTMGLKIDYQKLRAILKDSDSSIDTPSTIIGLFCYCGVHKNVNLQNNPKFDGYEIISKEIVFIEGKATKGNLDSEIIRDIYEKINEYDTLILLSGDGDFTCILESLKTHGKKVIVGGFHVSINKGLKSLADEYVELSTLPIFLEKQFLEKKIVPLKPKPLLKPNLVVNSNEGRKIA